MEACSCHGFVHRFMSLFARSKSAYMHARARHAAKYLTPELKDLTKNDQVQHIHSFLVSMTQV
jgi:hypothetical protein